MPGTKSHMIVFNIRAWTRCTVHFHSNLIIVLIYHTWQNYLHYHLVVTAIILYYTNTGNTIKKKTFSGAACSLARSLGSEWQGKNFSNPKYIAQVVYLVEFSRIRAEVCAWSSTSNTLNTPFEKALLIPHWGEKLYQHCRAKKAPCFSLPSKTNLLWRNHLMASF